PSGGVPRASESLVSQKLPGRNLGRPENGRPYEGTFVAWRPSGACDSPNSLDSLDSPNSIIEIQAVHLDVESLARQPKVFGSLGDVAGRSLEGFFNHLLFKLAYRFGQGGFGCCGHQETPASFVPASGDRIQVLANPGDLWGKRLC